MYYRTDRNGLVNRVDTDVTLAEFANHRQALVNLLLTQVAQVEMNNVAVITGNRSTFLLLMPERLA